MLPKLLKKGVLCVAFAAAVGGAYHFDHRNPSQTNVIPAVNYDQPPAEMPASERHARSAALEAVIYEVRNVDLDKALKAGKITQGVRDDAVKDDDNHIAILRQQFIGKTTLMTFDGYFLNELKKDGIKPPAKPPQLEQQAKPAGTPGKAGPAPKASS